MKLYGIKNCGSVKKARHFLDTHNITYDFIDFKVTPPSMSTIESWIRLVGIDTLFNAKSATFRSLGMHISELNDEQKKTLLCEKSLLIKRPVLEENDTIIVGFDESVYDGLFS